MKSKVKEMKMDGSAAIKLKEVMFAAHLNRDSLSRILSQDSILCIDFFIYHMISCLYGAIERSINGDEDTMNQMQVQIQNLLNDLQDLQKSLFKTGVSNE